MPDTPPLTVDSWLEKVNQRFADQRFGEPDEADFRATFAEIKQVFASWRALNVKRVKGATYPVPFLDNLELIPPEYRILGMEAVARVGLSSGDALAVPPASYGLYPPVTFQLQRDSAGAVDALVDEEPATVATVQATWVRMSGLPAEIVDSFPPFVFEGRTPSYRAGDRFSYVFGNGAKRLLEVRHDLDTYVNPLPTGEDDDPNYVPYAPLRAASNYDDTAVLTRLDDVENEAATATENIDTLFDLHNEVAVELEDTRLTAEDAIASVIQVETALGSRDSVSVPAQARSTWASIIQYLVSALSLKASLASPALSGTPTGPTADNGTNSPQLATTAFVSNALDFVGDPTQLPFDNNLVGNVRDVLTVAETARLPDDATVNFISNAEFAAVTSGELAITPSERRAGVTVGVVLGPGVTLPASLSSPPYRLLAGSTTDPAVERYASFHVLRDLRVTVVITAV